MTKKDKNTHPSPLDLSNKDPLCHILTSSLYWLKCGIYNICHNLLKLVLLILLPHWVNATILYYNPTSNFQMVCHNFFSISKWYVSRLNLYFVSMFSMFLNPLFIISFCFNIFINLTITPHITGMPPPSQVRIVKCKV